MRPRYLLLIERKTSVGKHLVPGVAGEDLGKKRFA